MNYEFCKTFTCNYVLKTCLFFPHSPSGSTTASSASEFEPPAVDDLSEDEPGPSKKAKYSRLKLSRFTAEVIRCSQHISSRAAADLANALIADLYEQDKLDCEKSELIVDKCKIDREKERVSNEPA